MRRIRVPVQLAFGLIAVLSLVGVSIGQASAATNYARITLHVSECSSKTKDLFGKCHNNRVKGVTFYIAGAERTTGANGEVTAAPGAGRRSIRLDAADAKWYEGSYVFCSDQKDGDVLYNGRATTTIYITTTANQPVICDWYLLT